MGEQKDDKMKVINSSIKTNLVGGVAQEHASDAGDLTRLEDGTVAGDERRGHLAVE